MPEFSPLYLIPLGGGQLAQDRPCFALGYLGVQVGLLAWYLRVQQDWSRATELGELSKEHDLGQQKDLLLGRFITAAVASVVEAVAIGLLGE